MPSVYLPGGKARTEKYIRAEQKNRLERTRLDLSQKFFERETIKTKFRIEREKKLLSRAHSLVKRTSGHSEEGCPPDDKYDREYEKSMVFQNGIRLTNLRLTNWRIHEKELQSFLENIHKDMDKLAPGKHQKVQVGTEAETNLSINKQPEKSNVFNQSVQDLNSSYQDISDYDEEEDGSSVYSGDASQMSLSCSSGYLKRSTPTSTAVRKRVTFARPHTTGALLRRTNSNQTPSTQMQLIPKDTTHFLITKGGTLMNTDGTYKSIKTPSLIVKEKPVTTSDRVVGQRKMMVNRLQSDQSFSSLESFRAEDFTSRNRVFSPCSENSSIGYYLPETSKSRCAPSPIGNLPMQTNLSTGRPNSRLGIFLPPEKEFSKRQHFSHRRRLDSTGESSEHELNPKLQINPWKSRLVLTESSGVRIRSLGSVATVLRAALAFSKSRRQNILQGILDENDKQEKRIIDEERKRRNEIFTKTPDIDINKQPLSLYRPITNQTNTY